MYRAVLQTVCEALGDGELVIVPKVIYVWQACLRLSAGNQSLKSGDRKGVLVEALDKP